MTAAAQAAGHVNITPGLIAAVTGALLGLAAICWLARALLHMARLARAQGQAPSAPPERTGGGKGRTALAVGGIITVAGWLYEKAATHPAVPSAAPKPAAPAPAAPVIRPPAPHAVTQAAHPLLSGWQIVIIIAVLAVAALAAWANRSRP